MTEILKPNRKVIDVSPNNDLIESNISERAYASSFIQHNMLNNFMKTVYYDCSDYDFEVVSCNQISSSYNSIHLMHLDDPIKSICYLLRNKKEIRDICSFSVTTFVDGMGYTRHNVFMSVYNPRITMFNEEFFHFIKNMSFNKSEYNGKVLKVICNKNVYEKIEIINTKVDSHTLILTPLQETYGNKISKILLKNKRVRYLFNGPPGCGKTDLIRKISGELDGKATFIIPEFTTSNDLTSILEACEIFDNPVVLMDDIDLALGSRDNGSYTNLLGQFLSYFDGIKKTKLSIIASTNDKGLVDKAAERPGRFNMIIDFDYLTDDQIKKVCELYIPNEFNPSDVAKILINNIDGKKPKVTGAFIANLGDNIKDMSEADDEWCFENTEQLITSSYKGFYSSQISKETKTLGFQV